MYPLVRVEQDVQVISVEVIKVTVNRSSGNIGHFVPYFKVPSINEHD